jgi:NitT/TauT family transport system substrate-binding protein
MMTRRIAAIGMAGAVALALTACSAPTAPSPGDSTEPVVVRVGIERIASIAPLYIADAKGYFADAGIDLEVQNVTSGQDAIPLAASGQLDVVVAGFSAGMFNAIANGLDVTVVGAVNVASGDLETSPSSLLVRKALVDSGEVTEVADLAGRTIGTVGGVGSSGGFLVGQVLEGGGLGLDDVTIENIPIPDVPAALESGGIDAGWTSAPFNTLALRDGVAVTLGVPTAGTTPVGVIFSGAFAQSAAAQPFFDAFARGSQALADGAVYDPENIRIIAEAVDQDPEVLAGLPLYTEYLPDLAPQPEVLDQMQQIWIGAGAIDYESPLDPAEYVDTSFSAAVR